jgi:hypothetical protein
MVKLRTSSKHKKKNIKKYTRRNKRNKHKKTMNQKRYKRKRYSKKMIGGAVCLSNGECLKLVGSVAGIEKSNGENTNSNANDVIHTGDLQVVVEDNIAKGRERGTNETGVKENEIIQTKSVDVDTNGNVDTNENVATTSNQNNAPDGEAKVELDTNENVDKDNNVTQDVTLSTPVSTPKSDSLARSTGETGSIGPTGSTNTNSSEELNDKIKQVELDTNGNVDRNNSVLINSSENETSSIPLNSQGLNGQKVEIPDIVNQQSILPKKENFWKRLSDAQRDANNGTKSIDYNKIGKNVPGIPLATDNSNILPQVPTTDTIKPSNVAWGEKESQPAETSLQDTSVEGNKNTESNNIDNNEVENYEDDFEAADESVEENGEPALKINEDETEEVYPSEESIKHDNVKPFDFVTEYGKTYGRNQYDDLNNHGGKTRTRRSRKMKTKKRKSRNTRKIKKNKKTRK